MPRVNLKAIALVALCVALSSCGSDEPKWKKLPSSVELPYYVSIKTYKDGEYADQPFELRLSLKANSNIGGRVLLAHQCKNVRVAQTDDYLYVFYDELVLGGFASSPQSASLPRPLLCDIRQEVCQETIESMKRSRVPLAAVCSYEQ